MKAVEIKNLNIEYRTVEGTVYAVNNLDIELEKGKTLGLVGETGAGKSTTALAMMGLIPNPPGVITSGEIVVEGKNITKSKEKELEKIRGNVVSMIFQDPMTSLNPVINVEDQIAEVIEQHQNVNYKKSVEMAGDMLELVGIDRYRGKEYPHQFSGGMKQRVVIAIALACNPDVLIADEPTTALDVTIQAQVMDMMKKLKDEYKTSMVMITHDLGIVSEMCDTVAIMYAGRIVEYGSLDDIFRRTKHPYTEGLFDSIPNILDRRARLVPIRGLMADPTIIPKGCSFAPRCKYCKDICKNTPPEKIYDDKGHYTECHLYKAENKLSEKVIKREGK